MRNQELHAVVVRSRLGSQKAAKKAHPTAARSAGGSQNVKNVSD